MLVTMQDGSTFNKPEIICAGCHKTLSHCTPPQDVKYWFGFCSAECISYWIDRKIGKSTGKVAGV